MKIGEIMPLDREIILNEGRKQYVLMLQILEIDLFR